MLRPARIVVNRTWQATERPTLVPFLTETSSLLPPKKFVRFEARKYFSVEMSGAETKTEINAAMLELKESLRNEFVPLVSNSSVLLRRYQMLQEVVRN